MTVPFSVQIVVRDRGPGVWKTARVDIFEGNDAAARQIGSYERNHAGWCAETFTPFMQNDRWYALYAPDLHRHQNHGAFRRNLHLSNSRICLTA